MVYVGKQHEVKLRKETESEIRLKWPKEESDFTPWLSNNLDRLSTVLGIDLELEGTEVEVGPYRADIVARIPASDAIVVIENQLTHADPRHLGQLVTYVARMKAKTGVWVAPGYWYTNVCAVRSLNRLGPDSAGYFAVKLSLSNSDCKTLCPNFDVIEHPKRWQDPVALDFWSFLKAQFSDQPRPSFNSGSNMRRGRYDVKEANLKVVQHFEADIVRVYVTGRDEETEEEVVKRIDPHRPNLERALAEPGVLKDDGHYCESEFEVNAHNRLNWEEIARWFCDQRRNYERALLRGQR